MWDRTAVVYSAILNAVIFSVFLWAINVVETPESKDIPTEVTEWAEENVWYLNSKGGGHGSGFWIDHETMISACHVVSNQDTATARDNNEKYEVTLDVVSCDKDLDLAVLKRTSWDYTVGTDGSFTVDVPLAGTTEVTELPPLRGTFLYGPGFPLYSPLMITVGHWQQFVEVQGTSGYLVTVPTINGDSGSPVISWDGTSIRIEGVRVAVALASSSRGFSSPITHLTLVKSGAQIKQILDSLDSDL